MIKNFLFALLNLVSLVHCTDNLRIRDLPYDTANDLKAILKEQDLTVNCTNQFQAINLKYLLYNRTNFDNPVPFTSSTYLSRKSLVLIVPGWLTTPTSTSMQDLKNAYLLRYNTNVVILDWSTLAFKPYTNVFCNIPNISYQVSTFLCDVSDVTELELSNVHIVGYSFGAHIAGYLGRTTILQCNKKIGRITGLDPAGPIYKHLSEAQRLYITDALFVDVIYTSPLLGLSEKCGRVNIRANCFRNQPGCPKVDGINEDTLVSDSICSSLRSLELMTESVNSNQLIAVSCSRCFRMCRPDLFTEMYLTVGEDCVQPSEFADHFIIFTGDNAPYGQGLVPYSIN